MPCGAWGCATVRHYAQVCKKPRAPLLPRVPSRTVAHRSTAPEPHQLPQRRRSAPFRAKLRERRPQLPEPLGLAQLEGRDEYLGEHGHRVERAPDHEVYQVVAGLAVDL